MTAKNCDALDAMIPLKSATLSVDPDAFITSTAADTSFGPDSPAPADRKLCRC